MTLPFALPQRPAGDDPQGNHKNQQHSARTNCHEGLKHESRVKVNAIESADTPGRRVGEQLAVKKHDPADEVEPEEHGQGQGHIVRHPRRADITAFICQLRGPQEVILAWNWVHRADAQFESNLRHPLPRHSDPPIISAVVDHEQLQKARNCHTHAQATVQTRV